MVMSWRESVKYAAGTAILHQESSTVEYDGGNISIGEMFERLKRTRRLADLLTKVDSSRSVDAF
ncbi:hypothetical protein FHT85_001543 [Rhizobium sp. BK312]|nr:hypothetical protein [Rhizobium sp. BK312]